MTPKIAPPMAAPTQTITSWSGVSVIVRVSSPVRLGVPGVHLVLPLLAPRVQRVVQDHAVLQHLVIVRKDAREPERDGSKSRRLRRKLELRGIGAAHDQRKALQRRVGAQPVMLDE